MEGYFAPQKFLTPQIPQFLKTKPIETALSGFVFYSDLKMIQTSQVVKTCEVLLYYPPDL
jgi:hypothetical protein